MKAWVGAVALIAAMGCGQAMADGNELLSTCQTAIRYMDGERNVNGFDIGYCSGIVEAVEQSLMIMNNSLPKELRTCYPQDGTTNGQKARIVVKYLLENPDKLDMSAPMLAMAAYKAAYACKG